ncbi:hypothetical protein CPC08DRAFT_756400 [Agrocybe pediades]|nr:hypothetical protein CPC08DRAFT_756400 [Agrocybe pediades]
MILGYGTDTGGSKLIAEGKIKLKSGSQIVRFTQKSIVFEDGSELEADVVVFATGLGKQTDKIARVLGPTLAEQCAPLWGLDEEGELQGAWKQLGTKNGLKGLWYMMGNLALCRFHSSHLTLQIKAIEEGLIRSRASAILNGYDGDIPEGWDEIVGSQNTVGWDGDPHSCQDTRKPPSRSTQRSRIESDKLQSRDSGDLSRSIGGKVV